MTTRRPIKLGLVDPIRGAKIFVPVLERSQLDFLVIESGLVAGVPEAAGTAARCVRAAPSAADMAGTLRSLGVTHVIGCVEHSMRYADQLCAEMGLAFSGLRLSEARRNKRLMIETLRAAGLRVPGQLETARLEELRAWVQAHGYPVVLKPVSSGGTDNVFLCGSDADVRAAFDAIVGAKDFIGTTNTSVLAQEYVDGVEYIVDCVSWDGIHATIAFSEYQKGTRNGRAFIYEKVRVLGSDHPVCERLRPFAYAVLDALEVRSGASHMEVKVNARGEIVFIEVGARVSGGDSYRMVQHARKDGKSQVDYVLDTIQGRPLPDDRYQSGKAVVRVCIISEAEGRVRSLARLEAIQGLRSLVHLQLNVDVGAMLAKTTDLATLAGYVDLAHPEPAVLAEDERHLDEILREGIFVLDEG